MFLTMWDFIKGEEADFDLYRPQVYQRELPPDDGYIQPFADNPLDDEPVGENVYLNMISRAKKYVYITTPYLIPSNEMMTALCNAARSGVDVRIITPHVPDKWYVHMVSRAHYSQLVGGGGADLRIHPRLYPRQELRRRWALRRCRDDQPRLPPPLPPFRVRHLDVRRPPASRTSTGFPRDRSGLPGNHPRTVPRRCPSTPGLPAISSRCLRRRCKRGEKMAESKNCCEVCMNLAYDPELDEYYCALELGAGHGRLRTEPFREFPELPLFQVRRRVQHRPEAEVSIFTTMQCFEH